MRHRFVLLAALAASASPAVAEQRDFCAERPGQTTPPCTLSPGTLMIETGLIDWSRSTDDSGVMGDSVTNVFRPHFVGTAGPNVGMGTDHTLFAKADGTVSFATKRNGRVFISVKPQKLQAAE